MGSEFKKVLVLGRQQDSRVAEPMAALVEHLTKAGIEVLRNENAEGTDLVIAIGGDGTMLYAGNLVRDHDVPLLGINRGRLGFLADVTPGEMLTSVDHVLDGVALAAPAYRAIRTDWVTEQVMQAHAEDRYVYVR